MLAPIVCAQTGCSFAPLGLGVLPNWTYGTVSCVEVFDDGTGAALYVGGQLANFGGINVPPTCANGQIGGGVGRWNGMSWSVLGNGFSHVDSTGTVWCGFPTDLEVFDSGTGPRLYASAVFTSPGSISTNPSAVLVWNGSAWNRVGAWFDKAVYCLEAFDIGNGPTLFAGGKFTFVGGTAARGVAAWNGATWSGTGLGPAPTSGGTSAVYTLRGVATTASRDLYAGGSFGIVGAATPASDVARYDGFAWWPLGPGLNNDVNALEVFDDGSGPKLVAGGKFTASGNTPANLLAVWNGTGWTEPAGGLRGPSGATNFTPGVADLQVYDDGTGPALYAGGLIGFAGGFAIPVNNLVRWNGGPFTTSWSDVGGGVTGITSSMQRPSVSRLAVFSGSGGVADLHVGGLFTAAGGIAVNNITRWSCGSGPGLAIQQPGGPGAAVHVEGFNLLENEEYFTVFSTTLAPGGPGTGSYLGLDFPSLAPLFVQLAAPLGFAPFHFRPSAATTHFGPYLLPPVTVDAVLFRVTGTAIRESSRVLRTSVL